MLIAWLPETKEKEMNNLHAFQVSRAKLWHAIEHARTYTHTTTRTHGTAWNIFNYLMRLSARAILRYSTKKSEHALITWRPCGILFGRARWVCVCVCVAPAVCQMLWNWKWLGWHSGWRILNSIVFHCCCCSSNDPQCERLPITLSPSVRAVGCTARVCAGTTTHIITWRIHVSGPHQRASSIAPRGDVKRARAHCAKITAIIYCTNERARARVCWVHHMCVHMCIRMCTLCASGRKHSGGTCTLSGAHRESALHLNPSGTMSNIVASELCSCVCDRPRPRRHGLYYAPYPPEKGANPKIGMRTCVCVRAGWTKTMLMAMRILLDGDVYIAGSVL